MIQLAIGFAFNQTKTSVLLIKKARPEIIRGYYTGIGGHKEAEDDNLATTMAREFSEEAMIWISPGYWKPVGEPMVRGEDDCLQIHSFTTVLDEYAACRVRSGNPDEQVRWFTTQEAMINPHVYHDTPALVLECLKVLK